MALGLLVLTIAAAALWFRPPQPGHVYTTRSDMIGLPESTALLLRNGKCLSLSMSTEDIGRSDAATGSGRRLFAIATGRSVIAGEDAHGLYLEDKSSGLRARPGDAIEGEMIAPPIGSINEDRLGNSLAVGWPISRHCGHALASVFSVTKVTPATG